jgi:hypothetical protein
MILEYQQLYKRKDMQGSAQGDSLKLGDKNMKALSRVEGLGRLVRGIWRRL